MKNCLLAISLVFALGACKFLGSEDGPAMPDNGGGGGGGNSHGVFHPGPYTDPTTGKSCGAPGGYCESDEHCHSSADKCH